jgi:hypothetical protein
MGQNRPSPRKMGRPQGPIAKNRGGHSGLLGQRCLANSDGNRRRGWGVGRLLVHADDTVSCFWGAEMEVANRSLLSPMVHSGGGEDDNDGVDRRMEDLAQCFRRGRRASSMAGVTVRRWGGWGSCSGWCGVVSSVALPWRRLKARARVDSDDGARGCSHMASPAPTSDLPRRSSDEVWRGRAEANVEFSSRRSHGYYRLNTSTYGVHWLLKFYLGRSWVLATGLDNETSLLSFLC